MIKNYSKLASTELRKKALKIIDSGLDAIKTDKIIKKDVLFKKNILTVRNKKYDLKKYKKIYVIGFGKASSEMGREIEKILGKRIDGGIIISTKKTKLKKIKVIKGTHPFPIKGNVNATKKIVNLLKKSDKNDLVICLISGGGSSLLCYPNIDFDRYLGIMEKAFKSGIDIKAFNKIRKKYSNVKDGKLAKLTKAKIVSLIFSDVIGDDLATIASGPTYPGADNILLLNNKVALEAMHKKAEGLGLKPRILTNKLSGEAKVVGKKILKKINNNFNKKIKTSKKNNCYLFAGETTVTVKGKGKGGRNQELCLGAMEEIGKLKNAVLVSVGTDGRDGPTDAAGAVVDNDSLKKAEVRKLNYRKYLDNNDSYNFFKKMDDLVITGLTGSNVADVGVILKL